MTNGIILGSKPPHVSELTSLVILILYIPSKLLWYFCLLLESLCAHTLQSILPPELFSKRSSAPSCLTEIPHRRSLPCASCQHFSEPTRRSMQLQGPPGNPSSALRKPLSSNLCLTFEKSEGQWTHPWDLQGGAKFWKVYLTLLILNRCEQVSAIAITPTEQHVLPALQWFPGSSDNLCFSHRDTGISKHSEANFLSFTGGAFPLNSVHNVGFEDLVQQSS